MRRPPLPGHRATGILACCTTGWRENATIVAVVCLIIGAKLIGGGISTLGG